MGISSWLGLGEATTRILKRYGGRSGSIINATGTGTQVVLYLNNYSRLTEGVSDIFNEDNKLYITAFSTNGSPIRPHSIGVAEAKRTLTGRIVSYRKYPTIDIDITVIGNSLDYYKLSMLSSFYLNRGAKTYIPRDDDPNDPAVIEQIELGTYQDETYTKTDVPLLNMDINPNSAPGARVTLTGGIMTDCDSIFGIDGNSRVSDRTFSFSFAAISEPVSWSKQHYDTAYQPNLVEQFTGVEII